MTTDLLTPILNLQSPDVNFFEGRLLTGRDLRDQQEANHNRFLHLGQAIGAGVINGLEVELVNKGSTVQDPVLKVKAGVALNAEGQVLELEADNDISLISKKSADLGSGLFTPCRPPKDSVELTDFGIYILVMSPAAGFGAEQAPKIGLEDQGVARDCGQRYAIKGVQFRLEELKPSNLNGISETTRTLYKELLEASDLADLSKLQNLVAHLCFGSEVLEGIATDPFAMMNSSSAFKKYGAIDDLNDLKRLSNCDVPLAVMHWTRQGISYLDLWSVRRQPYEHAPISMYSFLANSRRNVETTAAFFYFQAHLDKIFKENGPVAVIKAIDYFLYLPASGFLRIATPALGSGFSLENFFDGKTIRGPLFIEGSHLEEIFSQSFRLPPIRLSDEEMIWLYFIRENKQAKSEKLNDPSSQIVVFASSYMDYFSKARFDVSRWDYSNYFPLVL